MTSVSERLASLQEDELQEMKKQLRELRKDNEACKLENGALHQQNRALTEENGSLQQKNEELKSENVTLTSIIEELTDQICAKPKRISDLGNFTGLNNPENVCYIRKLINLILLYFIFISQLFNDMALACASDLRALLNMQTPTIASLSDIESVLRSVDDQVLLLLFVTISKYMLNLLFY